MLPLINVMTHSNHNAWQWLLLYPAGLIIMQNHHRCKEDNQSIHSQNRCTFRISTLLKVAVDEDEWISPYVCNNSMCTPRLENLEKANADLQAFRELAQCSLEAQTNPMKRTRVTSGEVGVSPDTARARPSSKLSRKKLTYECK